MPRRLPWMKSLNAKLGGITLLLLAVSLVLVVGNLYLLSTIKGDSAAMNYTGKGRMRAYQALYLVRRMLDESGEARTRTRGELGDVMRGMEERFTTLRAGDPRLGIPPATDTRILEEIKDREEIWRTKLKPAFERATSKATFEESAGELSALDGEMAAFVEKVDEGIALYQTVSEEKVGRFQVVQYLFVGFVLLIVGMVFWLVRGIAGRARALATTAERIAGGELALEAPVSGSDELAMLGDSFNAMTANLRQTLKKLSAQETRGRTILNSTADGIITIDGQGLVQTFNAAAENLFGYAGEEVIGKNVSMLMPTPYREEHDGYLSRYLRTGEAKIIGREREVEGKRRDGTTFPLALRVRPMGQEGHQEERLFVGVVQDITARKKLEEARAQLVQAITEAASILASGTSEILAGTTQQASSAQEQAAAVSETMTTVDEITQTSDQAAQRARAVADTSNRSVEIGKAGRKAVEDSALGMGTVQEQVESIAESILALAEQAQAIGEIIATVNDIAEQTNLLALNAGIEASRAGEHGKGFQVVAVEVKALAGQAKKATGQVRQILGDIQKATHRAVLTTEEGQKSVNATLKLVGQAGDTIKSLADTIAETAQAAAQIAASAGQQAAGMAQIHQAMKNINQATNQNLASTKQQERAAQDLNGLGVKLKDLLGAQGR